MPLHQLPNGTWIEPAMVLQIIPRPASEHIECRVDVIIDGHDHTLHFDDFSAAQAYADSLASIVNAAREKIA